MKEVNASIITIGDELLIGQTIDTNSAFIAQELNKIGIWVKRRIAVGDVKNEILSALKQQSKDCQVIIITGGLGPTADDITKPTLCEYFNSKIVVNEEALQNVKDIFTRLNRPLIERNLKQAEVPDNCMVLPNLRGTAPGMWFEKEQVIYVSLPGVPTEMKGLIQHSVVPKLMERMDLPAVVHRTLLTFGIGESFLAETVSEFENNLPGHIKLAYLPAYGLVRLRLTGRGSRVEELEQDIEAHFETLKHLVKAWKIADRDLSLEEVVSQLLKERKKTVATAESCTGGYIAHLITSKPGSSAIYNGSVISYSNEVKENVLHVRPGTLQQYGAVSEQTVIEMAQGILTAIKADYAIATSGIMGPEGGSPEKPVGTVWIAVGTKERIKASKHHFRYDRTRNIEMTSQMALNLLRKFLLEEEE
jgi:nicotinamide-nucleotide amidase